MQKRCSQADHMRMTMKANSKRGCSISIMAASICIINLCISSVFFLLLLLHLLLKSASHESGLVFNLEPRQKTDLPVV